MTLLVITPGANTVRYRNKLNESQYEMTVAEIMLS